MADVVPIPDSTENRILGLRTESLDDRKFSVRDVGAALLVAAGLYLLNGEYAATACNLLTSVPAAIFTYKVLTQSSSFQPDYKSILFFWTVQGTMTLLDAILSDSAGYFLGKFALLAAVFGNAASKNKDVLGSIISVDGLKTEFTQCVTSIVSLYDSEGYPVQSPPPTTFSEDDSPQRSCVFHNEELSEEEEDDEMESTQRNSHSHDMGYTHGVNRALTPHPEMLINEFADHAESQATVCVAFGDLVTNPMENVVFGVDEDTKTVTVVNVSGENAMWALKSNALHRLGAMPACGVINSGSTQEIRLIRHGSGEGDKVAIDYALVGGERNYSPLFVERSDKKRHLLRVSYL